MMKKIRAGRRNRVEIAAEALLLAAGIVITVVLISLMVDQMKNAMELSSAVTESISDAAREIREGSITQYDGVNMTGTDVVNICTRFVRESGLTLIIDKGGVGSSRDMLYVRDSNAKDMLDPTSAMYVKPSGRWHCDVVRNANDVITGMIFTII